tara:strand:+ start:6074 stop:6253 length:180 start_codon:yes stop_codon:yes gene_type:complete
VKRGEFEKAVIDKANVVGLLVADGLKLAAPELTEVCVWPSAIRTTLLDLSPIERGVDGA